MQSFVRLCAIVLLAAAPARGAEYFVDARAAGREPRDGSALRPWSSLGEGLARLQPGDVLSVRPGVYRQEQVSVKQDRVRLRKDPSLSGAVVIDGGVSRHLLRNQDRAGRQKASDNGPHFRAVIEVNGHGVTLEGLEVRYGYVGISLRGQRGTVRGCHVHHVGQHGIEVTNDGGRVEDCLVHDANLYNVNGQCLVGGAEPGSGRPDQNTRKKINSPDPRRHGKNMDWGQGITFHGKYREAWAPRGCVIRGNIVWNIWGEGIATYNASDVRMEDNVAINVWRIAYYVQNADDVRLGNNLALYTPDFRARLGDGAMAVAFSFANEYPGDHLRQAEGPGQPWVPDGSNIILRDNVSWRGDYALHSGDRHLVGTRGGIWVKNNSFLLPAFVPCINLNSSVTGPVRIRGNLLAREGREKEEPGYFLFLEEGVRANLKKNRLVPVFPDDPRVKSIDESISSFGKNLEREGPDFRKKLFSGIDALRRLFFDFKRDI
jgi:hypothetical protein